MERLFCRYSFGLGLDVIDRSIRRTDNVRVLEDLSYAFCGRDTVEASGNRVVDLRLYGLILNVWAY